LDQIFKQFLQILVNKTAGEAEVSKKVNEAERRWKERVRLGKVRLG
jgi:hypothetical protein